MKLVFHALLSKGREHFKSYLVPQRLTQYVSKKTASIKQNKQHISVFYLCYRAKLIANYISRVNGAANPRSIIVFPAKERQ